MKYHITISLLFLAVISGNVEAQTRLTLEQCLQEATQQSRLLQVGQKNVESAKAAQGSAWAMDKTEISLSQDPTTGGSVDNALTLGQSFDFPTVYLAKHRQLKAETELANREYNVLQKQVTACISSLYCDLDCAQNTIGVYARQDSLYTIFVNRAEAKYKNGDIGQLEVMNAHQALQDNRMQLSSARLQYQQLQRQLRDVMGVDYLVETVAPSTFNSEKIPATSYDFSQSAQGQALEQQVEVSRQELSVARQEFAPSISIAARTQMIINGFNPYNIDRARFQDGNFMGFEVGVSVPIFFGGQRSKARVARLAVDRQETELQQAQIEAETAYNNAVETCELARQNLLYYEQTGHPESSEMARIAQTSYEHGEIDYVEYLQNQKSAVELHLNHLKALNAWQQSVIQLLLLM